MKLKIKNIGLEKMFKNFFSKSKDFRLSPKQIFYFKILMNRQYNKTKVFCGKYETVKK